MSVIKLDLPSFGYCDGLLYQFEYFDPVIVEYYGVAPKESDRGNIGWVPAPCIQFNEYDQL